MTPTLYVLELALTGAVIHTYTVGNRFEDEDPTDEQLATGVGTFRVMEDGLVAGYWMNYPRVYGEIGLWQTKRGRVGRAGWHTNLYNTFDKDDAEAKASSWNAYIATIRDLDDDTLREHLIQKLSEKHAGVKCVEDVESGRDGTETVGVEFLADWPEGSEDLKHFLHSNKQRLHSWRGATLREALLGVAFWMWAEDVDTLPPVTFTLTVKKSE